MSYIEFMDGLCYGDMFAYRKTPAASWIEAKFIRKHNSMFGDFGNGYSFSCGGKVHFVSVKYKQIEGKQIEGRHEFEPWAKVI